MDFGTHAIACVSEGAKKSNDVDEKPRVVARNSMPIRIDIEVDTKLCQERMRTYMKELTSTLIQESIRNTCNIMYKRTNISVDTKLHQKRMR